MGRQIGEETNLLYNKEIRFSQIPVLVLSKKSPTAFADAKDLRRDLINLMRDQHALRGAE